MKIQILPDNQILDVDTNKSILQHSLSANIPHAHACGGNGRCSSCRVLIIEGLENCEPRNEQEETLANTLAFSDEVRLACQTKVNGDVSVKRAILDEIDMELIGSNFKNTNENKSLGEEIEATMLFADIEGYTSVTEKALAYDVVHMLNRYYFSMGKIVGDHQGQIMDYFGDGFLAIYGVSKNLDHAEQAVQSAFKMKEAMNKMNPYFNNLFERDFNVRIGINSGSVILGSIGVEGMQKLAAIGDAVNMASRIEAANKSLSTNFLISQSTYHKVQANYVAKGEHQIRVKGKIGSHKVYEL